MPSDFNQKKEELYKEFRRLFGRCPDDHMNVAEVWAEVNNRKRKEKLREMKKKVMYEKRKGKE